MTLQAGTYTVTASLDGYISQSQNTNIIAGETTTVDFSLISFCDPISALEFNWLPAAPVNGEMITLTASSSGTSPIDFHWSFGDTFTGTGSSITHSYLEADTYTVELSASNACSIGAVSKNITIIQKIWQFFLPLLNKNELLNKQSTLYLPSLAALF